MDAHSPSNYFSCTLHVSLVPPYFHLLYFSPWKRSRVKWLGGNDFFSCGLYLKIYSLQLVKAIHFHGSLSIQMQSRKEPIVLLVLNKILFVKLMKSCFQEHMLLCTHCGQIRLSCFACFSLELGCSNSKD